MSGEEFRDKVLEMLKNRNGDLKLSAIARASGTTVYWLKKFQQDGTKDPSVVKVVNLYNVLSDKKLKF